MMGEDSSSCMALVSAIVTFGFTMPDSPPHSSRALMRSVLAPVQADQCELDAEQYHECRDGRDHRQLGHRLATAEPSTLGTGATLFFGFSILFSGKSIQRGVGCY